MSILKSKPMVPNQPRKTKRKPDARWQMLNHIIDIAAPDLTAHELNVLIYMFRHANSENFVTISSGRVAFGIGANRRNVVAWIGNLIKKGHLKIVVPGGVNHKPNRYLLVKRQEKNDDPEKS